MTVLTDTVSFSGTINDKNTARHFQRTVSSGANRLGGRAGLFALELCLVVCVIVLRVAWIDVEVLINGGVFIHRRVIIGAEV